MRFLVPTITLLLLWLLFPSLGCPALPQDDPAKILKAYYEGKKDH